MSARRIFVMLVSVAGVLAMAACTAALAGNAGVVGPNPNQTPGAGQGVVVPATSMSEADLALQRRGEAAPAGTGADAGITPAPGGSPSGGPAVVYSDATYRLSVAYPDGFSMRMQTAEKLAQLSPAPEVAFIFMNPEIAKSDVADLEPADLEIHVYATGDSASLDGWLKANGLLPADAAAQVFQTAKVSGVRVCADTMIAPGCSYFFSAGGRIYQLTPATLEGDAMVQSFAVLP